MILNEKEYKRLKELAGLLNEDTVVFSSSGGRSDKDTLGYYIEDYLINLSSQFVSALDSEFKKINETLVLIKEDSKIDKNNIFFKFKIKDNSDDFFINLVVNLEDSARTKCVIMYKSTKTEFDLNSKQSSADLKIFIKNSVEAVLNLIKVKS